MRIGILTIIALSIACLASAQVLITNTTVFDVENKKLLSNHYVMVQNGKITYIGGKITAPKGTRIIDGSGKFLIPGLVDTHMHFFQSGGVFTRPDEIDLRKYRPYSEEIAWTHNNMENTLRRYASVGITTVVDVGSTINFLIQRDSFRTKDYAPTIYMTGPLLTTFEPPVYKGLQNDGPFYEMKTVEDARNYVHKQLPYKPDFIKIAYLVWGSNKDSLARSFLPLLKAAIDETHKLGLRVAVHATQRIASQLAAEAGVDHLVHVVTDELVNPEYIQLLKAKKIVVSSSQIVFGGYSTVFGQNYRLNKTDSYYSHPAPLQTLVDFKNLPDTALLNQLLTSVKNGQERERRRDSILGVNLKRLVDAGVPVATSTDAGNIGTPHVSSYFRELQVMKQSGLDMWQLLQSSTINGAKAVGNENIFGSIKIDKRADMVLLLRNPLDKIDNWKTIDWVINKGVAWKPDSLFMRSILR